MTLSGRAQLVLGRSPRNVEFDASPGTSGHIRYFTLGTLEQVLRRAGLTPLGRWRPTLGHTLISVATKTNAYRPGA